MTTQQIISEVAQDYGITTDELLNGGRFRRCSEPRHVAMYLVNAILGYDNNALAVVFKRTRVDCGYAVGKVGDWVRRPVLNRRAAACVEHVTQMVTDIPDALGA